MRKQFYFKKQLSKNAKNETSSTKDKPTMDRETAIKRILGQMKEIEKTIDPDVINAARELAVSQHETEMSVDTKPQPAHNQSVPYDKKNARQIVAEYMSLRQNDPMTITNVIKIIRNLETTGNA